MSSEKKDYSLDSRENFILGQALQIAVTELKKVNEDWREDSNIQDMEGLQKMFPFTGIEKKYNYKIIIDVEENQKESVKMINETIKKMGFKCKVNTVEIL